MAARRGCGRKRRRRMASHPPSGTERPIARGVLEGHVSAEADRSGVRRAVVAVEGGIVLLVVPEVRDFAFEPDARAELVRALQRRRLVLVVAGGGSEVAVDAFEA